MRKSTVVVSGLDLQPPDQVLGLFKRHLLLFDEIVVGDANAGAEIPLMPSSPLRPEVDWLQERGLVRSANVTPERLAQIGSTLTLTEVLALAGHLRHATDAAVQARAMLQAAGLDDATRGNVMVPSDFFTVLARTMSFVARTAAVALPRLENVEAVPILYTGTLEPHLGRGDFETAIKVVVAALPTPDDSTPWEAILEFRADADARKRLTALRRWARTLAHGERSAGEIEDELLYLLDEYEAAVRLHRMKYRKGVMETLVVTGASVAEELVRLRFGKAAQAIFSIGRERLQLLEAERSAPGREVSFIREATARFGRRR